MIRTPVGRRSLLRALLLVVALGGPRTHAQSVQDPIALPFLDLPTAPALSALGGAGVAEGLGDPHAFLYNAAHLGSLSGEVALAAYPGAVDWLGLGLAARSTAASGGLSLRGLGLPATLGLAVARTTLDFGPLPVAGTATFAPQDRYTAVGLGLGLDLPVRLQAGAAVRFVSSTEALDLNADGGPVVGELSGATLDLGVRAEVPVLEVLGVAQTRTFRPTLDVAAGYAQVHVGGEVVAGASVQPLPRMARLGYATTLGLDYRTRSKAVLRLVEVLMTVQAEHQLTRIAADGTVTYEPFLGRLDPLENVLLARGSDVSTVRRGVRVGLFETLSLHYGHFDGFGYDDRRTGGFEVCLGGAVRLLALSVGHERLAALAERFDLRFSSATYFLDTRSESVFSGITLRARLP